MKFFCKMTYESRILSVAQLVSVLVYTIYGYQIMLVISLTLTLSCECY